MACQRESTDRSSGLPPWIRVRIGSGVGRGKVASILTELSLNTVCSSAMCPNLHECWHRQRATFMILGDKCTRNCRFCAVPHDSAPLPPDPSEPGKIAEAAMRLGLKYVVLTSVSRDDLPDGGSAHFAKVVHDIRKLGDGVKVEVLTPDYHGDSLAAVLDSRPDVFNHNVETVERLSREIRDKADYKGSLDTLAEGFSYTEGAVPVKSGLMVGLGETDDEVEQTMRDIRGTGCSMLTIGQYLAPSKEHWHVRRFVHPDKFEEWRKTALELGFAKVASAPLVRSSYNAEELSGEPISKFRMN
ncbi:MAG: lipoyl synthase, partial [Victivallales bacterium]|nr:lipoyl synthase [Victivallales bacterium]